MPDMQQCPSCGAIVDVSRIEPVCTLPGIRSGHPDNQCPPEYEQGPCPECGEFVEFDTPIEESSHADKQD